MLLGRVLPVRVDGAHLHELPGRSPCSAGVSRSATSTLPTFLLHFVPYYAVALTMAAVGGAGSYTFAAFALSAANFWIHILSTIYTVLRKSGSFVVTPKKGADVRQPRAVMPALVVIGRCSSPHASTAWCTNPDAATINNVSFAAVHISILHDGMLGGASEAARGSGRTRASNRGRRVRRTVHQTVSVVAAIAVVGVAMWFLSGCGSSSSSSSTTSGAGGAAPNPRAQAVAASRWFLKNYVTRDGAVSCGSIKAATPWARARRTEC